MFHLRHSGKGGCNDLLKTTLSFTSGQLRSKRRLDHDNINGTGGIKSIYAA